MSGQGFDLFQHSNGTILNVKVSAGASRDRISGSLGGTLKVSISTQPEKGKANKALIKLLAKVTGIKANKINIVQGNSSQSKKVLFEGFTAEELNEILSRVSNS